MFTFKRQSPLVSAVIMMGGSQVRVLWSLSEVINGCAIKLLHKSFHKQVIQYKSKSLTVKQKLLVGTLEQKTNLCETRYLF